eukprot:UN34370
MQTLRETNGLLRVSRKARETAQEEMAKYKTENEKLQKMLKTKEQHLAEKMVENNTLIAMSPRPGSPLQNIEDEDEIPESADENNKDFEADFEALKILGIDIDLEDAPQGSGQEEGLIDDDNILINQQDNIIFHEFKQTPDIIISPPGDN